MRIRESEKTHRNICFIRQSLIVFLLTGNAGERPVNSDRILGLEGSPQGLSKAIRKKLV